MCNACQGIVRPAALLEWNEKIDYDRDEDKVEEQYFYV